MKHIFSYPLMILVILIIIPGFLSASTSTVTHPGRGEASSEIALESDGTALYIAYTDNDGKLHLVTSHPYQGTQDTIVLTVDEGYLEDLALFSDGSLAIGYVLNGSLWIVRSSDGITFSSPKAVTPKEAVSIADFAVAEDDSLYVTYHRHSSHWDFNFGTSRDQGSSFTWKKDFTSDTDSSSSGYSGQIEYLNEGLYTAYQDNNDAFTVKFRFSDDGGQTWNIASIPSTLGTLDIAVNPKDENTVLISILNSEGSFVYRCTDARSESPQFTCVYKDEDVEFSRAHVRYTDIAFTDSGEAVLIYLDKNDSYVILRSLDEGSSWTSSQVIGTSRSRTGWWQPDLEVKGEHIYFGFYNENGDIDLYQSHPQQITAVNLIPDSDGYLYLLDILTPFSFTMENETAVFFSPDEDGTFTLTNESHAACEALFVVYDLDSADQQQVGMNWGTGTADQMTPAMDLREGGLYLILLSPLDKTQIGTNVRFSFDAGEMSSVPPESFTEIQYDVSADLSWSETAEQWRGEVGRRIQITLPPGGSVNPIWGDGIYSHDSPIGVAAVHAGLITFDTGGTVVIEMMGPQDSYASADRNGVFSNSYGYWHGSYRFITER